MFLGHGDVLCVPAIHFTTSHLLDQMKLERLVKIVSCCNCHWSKRCTSSTLLLCMFCGTPVFSQTIYMHTLTGIVLVD